MGRTNAHYLNAEQRVPRKVRQYAHNGLAGCVTQRRCRATGSLVSVYRNDQAGHDCTEPWSAGCEAHGVVQAFDRLDLADGHARNPAEWCDGCRAKVESTEQRSQS
jgi:hypothetical protein